LINCKQQSAAIDVYSQRSHNAQA